MQSHALSSGMRTGEGYDDNATTDHDLVNCNLHAFCERQKLMTDSQRFSQKIKIKCRILILLAKLKLGLAKVG